MATSSKSPSIRKFDRKVVASSLNEIGHIEVRSGCALPGGRNPKSTNVKIRQDKGVMTQAKVR
ncbi:hypothetical protein [Bifidobacterium apis]|uniref:hypothetical protein n=1 Tax=Bifidobacterium apis TaxID=3081440 RepID=UPI0030DC30E9